MARLRVGFFGAGLIAQYHAFNVHTYGAEFGDIVAVYDPDPEKAAAFEDYAVADEDAVIEQSDVIYVCTWTAEHERLVSLAATAGKAVFCEKPLGCDLASARRMTGLVARAGVTNQVGLVLRASPAFAWLRHLVDDPASGPLMSIMFRDDQYLPIDGGYASSWRGDVTKAGAGVLLEHSIHDVDILESIFGRVSFVSASMANLHGLDGIEDVAHCTLRFEAGHAATLSTVWHDMHERANERHLEVICRDLWCELNGNHHSGPVSWQRRGQTKQTYAHDELESALGSLPAADPVPDRAFLRAVAEGRPASPDFATALRAHVVVDALYRSAASDGRFVAV